MRITEVQWKGNYYTWTNKQIRNVRIASRIDRAFGNDNWIDKRGHAAIEYGNPGVSYHSPMNLLLHQSYHQIRVSFKFFNVWIKHESFMELVDTIWKHEYGSEVMRGIWYKLKALQPVLRQMNKKEFQFIGKKIEKARSELKELQEKLYNQAQDDLVIKEKELLIQLEKWSMLEENALRQKARAR